MKIWLTLILSTFLIHNANAQGLPSVKSNETPSLQTQNPVIHFSGAVRRGETFRKALWDNLVFILKANEAGWDISVADAADENSDFVWAATPPFRFDNARYLGTVYGHSAREAVAWSPRPFNFLVSGKYLTTAQAALNQLLWSYGIAQSALQAAEADLLKLPKGHGDLKIRHASVSKGKTGSEQIESLDFEVNIYPPIDLITVFRKQFLAIYPEYQTPEEACPNPTSSTVTIDKAFFADLNNDGLDEAAVLAYSCLAGTGGSDLAGVFTRLKSGETIPLATNSVDRKQSLVVSRGHFDIRIVNGTYIEDHRVYRENDPNCCPTGGIKSIAYRWNGSALVPGVDESLRR